jgi:hypothetical protein
MEKCAVRNYLSDCTRHSGGDFDVKNHTYYNQTYKEAYDDLSSTIDLICSFNPQIKKIILTVSPVPLTATYERHGALIATTYSKAVIRAVAGDISKESPIVEYFPSYEIINNPASRGCFYDGNLRTINSLGPLLVIKNFKQYYIDIDDHIAENTPSIATIDKGGLESQDLQCEDSLLEAFGDDR